MNTHDKIELPPLPPADRYFEFDSHRMKASIDIPYWGEKSLETYARAAIEADRQCRGSPVLVGWTVSTTGGGILHASKYTEYEAKRLGYSLPVYRLTSPQPTEPDLARCAECGAEMIHVRPGKWQHPDCPQSPRAAEPDKQHPDDVAVDAFAAAMKAKLKRAREEKGRGGWQDMSATELSAMLREHVEKGDPVDVANLAMMLHQNGQGITPAEPDVLPGEAVFGFAAWLTSLKVPVTFSECHGAAVGADLAAAYNASQGFDQVREDFHKRLKPYPKYEPSQPAEPGGYVHTVPDDCETLHWRGQILSLNELATISAEPVKRKRRYAQGTALGEFGIIPMCDQVDDEPVKVPSDADAKHIRDFIACDGMGAVIVEGPQYSAVVRALLARYGQTR